MRAGSLFWRELGAHRDFRGWWSWGGGNKRLEMLFRDQGRKKKGGKTPLSLENSPCSISSGPLHTFILRLGLYYVTRAVLQLLFGCPASSGREEDFPEPSPPRRLVAVVGWEFPSRFLALCLELCFVVNLEDILMSRMNKESTQANHRLVCPKYKAVAKEADICLLKCKWVLKCCSLLFMI